MKDMVDLHPPQVQLRRVRDPQVIRRIPWSTRHILHRRHMPVVAVGLQSKSIHCATHIHSTQTYRNDQLLGAVFLLLPFDGCICVELDPAPFVPVLFVGGPAVGRDTELGRAEDGSELDACACEDLADGLAEGTAAVYLTSRQWISKTQTY